MKKILSAITLFIIAVVAYGISFILGEDSVIGQAAGTLGLLMLLFAIIAAVREHRARRSATRPPGRV
jgi:formate hydrogenlyase subunit 3/multisubunit Na+/H+ antiporter MnhD subunit